MTKTLWWMNHVFSALYFILIKDLFVIFVKYWLYKQEEVYFWDTNRCWGSYLLLKFIHRSKFDPQNAHHNFRYWNIYNFTWELDALIKDQCNLEFLGWHRHVVNMPFTFAYGAWWHLDSLLNPECSVYLQQQIPRAW